MVASYEVHSVANLEGNVLRNVSSLKSYQLIENWLLLWLGYVCIKPMIETVTEAT